MSLHFVQLKNFVPNARANNRVGRLLKNLTEAVESSSSKVVGVVAINVVWTVDGIQLDPSKGRYMFGTSHALVACVHAPEVCGFDLYVHAVDKATRDLLESMQFVNMTEEPDVKYYVHLSRPPKHKIKSDALQRGEEVDALLSVMCSDSSSYRTGSSSYSIDSLKEALESIVLERYMSVHREPGSETLQPDPEEEEDDEEEDEAEEEEVVDTPALPPTTIVGGDVPAGMFARCPPQHKKPRLFLEIQLKPQPGVKLPLRINMDIVSVEDRLLRAALRTFHHVDNLKAVWLSCVSVCRGDMVEALARVDVALRNAWTRAVELTESNLRWTIQKLEDIDRAEREARHEKQKEFPERDVDVVMCEANRKHRRDLEEKRVKYDAQLKDIREQYTNSFNCSAMYPRLVEGQTQHETWTHVVEPMLSDRADPTQWSFGRCWRFIWRYTGGGTPRPCNEGGEEAHVFTAAVVHIRDVFIMYDEMPVVVQDGETYVMAINEDDYRLRKWYEENAPCMDADTCCKTYLKMQQRLVRRQPSAGGSIASQGLPRINVVVVPDLDEYMKQHAFVPALKWLCVRPFFDAVEVRVEHLGPNVTVHAAASFYIRDMSVVALGGEPYVMAMSEDEAKLLDWYRANAPWLDANKCCAAYKRMEELVRTVLTSAVGPSDAAATASTHMRIQVVPDPDEFIKSSASKKTLKWLCMKSASS